MAAPAEITVHNMSGVYTLNHKQSDSMSPVLKQQNVGYLIRKAIEHSNVETTMKQYTSPEGKECLDQSQISTGNMKNLEDRVMDWSVIETENWIWGKVKGQSRYTTLSEIEDAWLKEGWEQACIDGDIVENYVESLTDTWKVRQVWGFAEVQGVRKHVRRVLSTKEGKTEKVIIVYDWNKALDS